MKKSGKKPARGYYSARQIAAARRRIVRSGLGVFAWAEAHGVDGWAVEHLLVGKTQGTKGKSHAAAVALGLKKPWSPPSVSGDGGEEVRS